MSHLDALNHLTDGYTAIAQMTIQLADELGYIEDPTRYIVISPYGDDTSAGQPFIIHPVKTSIGKYRFSSYDEQWMHTVSPEFQVLVYEQIELEPLSNADEFDLLCDFASQFDKTSLIGTLLNSHLLDWVSENIEHPDILFELNRMRNIANQLEGHLDDLEELI